MCLTSWHVKGFQRFLPYLFLQLALALLQFTDACGALCQHGLLLLQRELQLQVLLTGALTNQAGAVELLLQRTNLKPGQDKSDKRVLGHLTVEYDAGRMK